MDVLDYVCISLEQHLHYGDAGTEVKVMQALPHNTFTFRVMEIKKNTQRRIDKVFKCEAGPVGIAEKPDRIFYQPVLSNRKASQPGQQLFEKENKLGFS